MGRLETWRRNRQKPRKLDGGGERRGKWNSRKNFVVGMLGVAVIPGQLVYLLKTCT